MPAAVLPWQNLRPATMVMEKGPLSHNLTAMADMVDMVDMVMVKGLLSHNLTAMADTEDMATANDDLKLLSNH